MLKRILFIFTLLFALAISAQKKAPKKQNNRSDAAKEAAMAVAEATMDAADPAMGNNPYQIDTLRINAGKPCVLIIKADEWNSQSFGDDQEKKELLKNFEPNTFEIINIDRYAYVLFENGQYLDVSGVGNSYEALAFWSGNIDDDIQTQEGRKLATEFVAQQLGLEKESSYLLNDKKYRQEIAALSSKTNFTPRTKMVLDAYLQMFSVPEVASIEDGQLLFNRDQQKVKSIKTYIEAANGKRPIYEHIELNVKGKPTSVSHYGSSGKVESTYTFYYENDRLQKIETLEKTISVSYNDQYLSIQQNIGAADQTDVYHLENDNLLGKTYMLMSDENESQMNTFSASKMVNNCIHRTINDEIWTISCSSASTEFPFTTSYTSYQDGEPLQQSSQKVIKKSAVLYDLFVNNENGSGFKQMGTFHLNERNLLQTFNFTKNDEAKKVILEYTYYP